MFLKILLLGLSGEAYNVSNTRNLVSVEAMAKCVAEVANKEYKKNIKVVSSKDKNAYYKHAVKAISLDISKFKQKFHYIPDTSVDKAFSRTLRFYLSKK